MNPEIKAKWVAALRSGDYEQGKGQLRNKNNQFCCLGVLCNLHAQQHPHMALDEVDPVHYLHAISTLPSEVRDWSGMNFVLGPQIKIGEVITSLASHNDSGKTFEEIADAIEAQL